MSTEVESSKTRQITATTEPIAIIQSDVAKAVNLAHPALLIAYFVARFSSLVANPVSALVTDLLPLVVIQSAFAVTCLPAAHGSSSAQYHPPPKAGKVTKKPSKHEPTVFNKATTAALALILTTVAATPVLSIIIVLFGAPFTTHHTETYLCVCHIALLAIYPLFYVHGVSGSAWREVLGALLPFDEVWGGTIGTVMGAWLGAIPIPLDWDRPWQTWPITIVTGAYLGYAVGKVIGAYVFRGKRISFEP